MLSTEVRLLKGGAEGTGFSSSCELRSTLLRPCRTADKEEEEAVSVLLRLWCMRSAQGGGGLSSVIETTGRRTWGAPRQ